MLTLLGLGVVVVGGLSVAAKLGKVNFETEHTVFGHTIEVELSQKQPFFVSVRVEERPAGASQAS